MSQPTRRDHRQVYGFAAPDATAKRLNPVQQFVMLFLGNPTNRLSGAKNKNFAALWLAIRPSVTSTRIKDRGIHPR